MVSKYCIILSWLHWSYLESRKSWRRAASELHACFQLFLQKFTLRLRARHFNDRIACFCLSQVALSKSAAWLEHYKWVRPIPPAHSRYHASVMRMWELLEHKYLRIKDSFDMLCPWSRNHASAARFVDVAGTLISMYWLSYKHQGEPPTLASYFNRKICGYSLGNNMSTTHTDFDIKKTSLTPACIFWDSS